MHTKMELETAKIGERGQVTIPVDFREELGLKKGEIIVFVREGEGLMLKPSKMIKSLERLKEDLIDLKIADQRLKEMEEGQVERKTKEEFLKELETW